MSSPQRAAAIANAILADAIPCASTTRYNRATLEALVTPPQTAAQRDNTDATPVPARQRISVELRVYLREPLRFAMDAEQVRNGWRVAAAAWPKHMAGASVTAEGVPALELQWEREQSTATPGERGHIVIVTAISTAAQRDYEAYCRARGLSPDATEETIIGECANPFPPVAHRAWQGKRSSLTRAEVTEYYEFLLSVVSAASGECEFVAGMDELALPAGWV